MTSIEVRTSVFCAVGVEWFCVELKWVQQPVYDLDFFYVEEQKREREFYSERGLTCDPKGDCLYWVFRILHFFTCADVYTFLIDLRCVVIDVAVLHFGLCNIGTVNLIV